MGPSSGRWCCRKPILALCLARPQRGGRVHPISRGPALVPIWLSMGNSADCDGSRLRPALGAFVCSLPADFLLIEEGGWGKRRRLICLLRAGQTVGGFSPLKANAVRR